MSYWAHLMTYFMRSSAVLVMCRFMLLSFCTLGERMLLPLMVRGYAQIASTAYAHPASKIVAIRVSQPQRWCAIKALLPQTWQVIQSFTAIWMAVSSEPHRQSDRGFSVLKLSAPTISRLCEVFANPTICAYPRTMRSGRKHLAKPAHD